MKKRIRIAVAVLALPLLTVTADSKPQKSMVDYFMPMPPVAPLVSEGIWGAPNALPRDVQNGMEHPDYCYWDGKIVKSDDGRYHIYCSRWGQEWDHHNGWHKGTKGVHLVSTNGIMGPYKDMGVQWPFWRDGLGHNVVGLQTHDGKYAMVTSEVTKGDIFISDSPDGPFEYYSPILLDYNGFQRGLARYNNEEGRMSNVKIMVRPDGRYMLAARTTAVMISDNGLAGPYKIMNEPVYNNHPVPSNEGGANEDTAIWYCGGLYHILYNNWPTKTFYHFSSEDGIHDWKYRGIAFTKEAGVFEYTDGTYNDWNFIESPTAFTEDDKVTHFKVAVIDVHKGEDRGNDNHRSKIIVIPFDGDGFNKDMITRHKKENAIADKTSLPNPWECLDIGNVGIKGNSGWDAKLETARILAGGTIDAAEQDALRFNGQKVSGDTVVSAQILCQDITANPAGSGVMFRKTMEADAPQVSLWIAPGKGIFSQIRSAKEAKVITEKLADYRAPYHLRLIKRDSNVEVWISCSDMYNWEKATSLKLDLGDEFHAGIVAASTNEKRGLARVKKMDIHPLGSQDKILNYNLPYTVKTGETLKVKFVHETSQPRDITLSMQDTTNWTGLNAVKHRVNGFGTLEFDYPLNNMKQNRDYRFLISMLEADGNWKTSIVSDIRMIDEIK